MTIARQVDRMNMQLANLTLSVAVALDRRVPDEVHERVLERVRAMNDAHAKALLVAVKAEYAAMGLHGEATIDWSE